MTIDTPLATRQEGRVQIITLDRPEARNALDLSLCHALTDAFTAADRDERVGAVLLNAAGSAFCAGADFKERQGRDAAWVRCRREAAFAAYRAIVRCSKPVLALVHGSVVGSGGEIAMSADFIYAADDTVFRFPEVHWGTVGATQRLQRAIGVRAAKELLFTGRDMPVDEAFERGLVQRVLPAADAFGIAMETVQRIAEAPALSARLTKAAVDQGAEVTLEQGIAIELSAIDRSLADNGWRDGLDRFAGGERLNDTGRSQLDGSR